MKLITSLFLVLFTYSSIISQEKYVSIPHDAITKDSLGNIVNMMEWIDRMNSGEWTADKVLDADGEFAYMQLRKTTEEEKARILETRKLIDGDFMVGEIAPFFSALDINGNLFNSKNYIGNVLVFNFWYLDCPPCMVALARFNELDNLYDENDKVKFVSITREVEHGILDLNAMNSFSFPIVAGATNICEEFQVNRFPTIIIINKEGVIVDYKIGGNRFLAHEAKSAINFALNDMDSQAIKKWKEEGFWLNSDAKFYLMDGTAIKYEKAKELMSQGYMLVREMDKEGNDYYLIGKPD